MYLFLYLVDICFMERQRIFHLNEIALFETIVVSYMNKNVESLDKHLFIYRIAHK